MKTTITLKEFVRIGGDINKLNIEKTFTDYSDKHNKKAIERIEYEGANEHAKLYNVYFKDGTKHRYADTWILTEVEFKLTESYVTADVVETKSSDTLKGFKTYRHESNPVEETLHNEFIKEFSKGIAMEQIAMPMKENGIPLEYLSDREKQIMISTIQWLGSPVGQSFLGNCGFEINNNNI